MLKISIFDNQSIIYLQFYDVQKCNSVQIVYSTYVVQKAKSLNYFATVLKYQIY